MCDKCGGTGIISERMDSFDKEKFRIIFDNAIEFVNKARVEYEASETDTDALLVLGTFLMVLNSTTENNLTTVMQFTLDQMDNDPKLRDLIMNRVMHKLGELN